MTRLTSATFARPLARAPANSNHFRIAGQPIQQCFPASFCIDQARAPRICSGERIGKAQVCPRGEFFTCAALGNVLSNSNLWAWRAAWATSAKPARSLALVRS